MWVHFNLVCDKKKQKQLHKMLRSRIKELNASKIIDGAVLTYHDDYPPCLYLCLEILSLKPPKNRSKLLSEESVRKIPEAVKDAIREAVRTYDDPFLERLEVLDYEVELMCNNAPFAYGGASIHEILQFASKGTAVALKILDDSRTKRKTWKSDRAIAEHIMKLLNESLTTPLAQLLRKLHFVCNPLGLSGCELYLRNSLSQTEPRDEFLKALYRWNEIG
jgi:hypothetical protein